VKIAAVRFDTARGGGTVTVGTPPSGGEESHLWRVNAEIVRASAGFPLSVLSAGGSVRVIVELQSDPAPSTRIWVHATPQGMHVLGAVPETLVEPERWNGIRCEVSIEIDASSLGAGGVDHYHAVWHWQCRSDAEPEPHDLGLTEHLLFVTITPPTEPWTGAGVTTGSRTTPWPAALMQACDWGRGARTHRQAASRIVESLFALAVRPGRSGPCLKYNGDGFDYLSPGMANPRWLDCEKFLKAVSDSASSECLQINCHEGAAVVVTFANLLGCSLVPCVVEGDCNDPYHVNRIRSLGKSSAASPSRFRFHVVGLDQESSDPLENLVYDVTLEIDEDAQPSGEPSNFVLPSGMPLGGPSSSAGSGNYLPQLIAAQSIGGCETRILEHAWVGTKPVQQSVQRCPLIRYNRYLEGLRTADGTKRAGWLSSGSLIIHGYRGRATYARQPGLQRMGLPRQPLATQLRFTSNAADSGQAIQVDYWTDDDPWITLSFMAELLAMIEVPVERVEVNGEVAYTVSGHTSVFVVQDGVAARFSSIGPAPLDMVEIYATAVAVV
jgi:hypothetical protein